MPPIDVKSHDATEQQPRPGTPIDQEAANRSTTVYLTDRRIDMVPELLSSNLCSLRGGVERFAFSCVWEMTREAEIVSTKFHKSIIRSSVGSIPIPKGMPFYSFGYSLGRQGEGKVL